MTAFRLLSLPLHGALELLIGIALMGAPFAFGFGAGALVTAVIVGALMVALALSATSETTFERGALTVRAHYELDQGLALGLLGVALVVGLAGDPAAAAAFGVAGVAQALLHSTTRYSAA